MASQKSSAVPPKRARGHARVEALLEAASTLFAERGYDQATMTEIAARSGTAIGSLYRFFPTKEALGETLLHRYFERRGKALDALATRATLMSAEELAEALIQTLVGARTDSLRAGAAAILDARGDAPDLRRTYRVERRRQVAAVLSKANPALGRERAQDRAAIIAFLIKGEHTIAQEEPSSERRWIRELRRLVTQYVVEALKA